MDDLSNTIFGKPHHYYKPSQNTRHNQEYSEPQQPPQQYQQDYAPSIRIPKQPNHFQEYTPVDHQQTRIQDKVQEVLAMPPNQILNLFEKRIYDIDIESRRLKHRLQKKRDSNLPDDVVDKIENNEDEIYENLAAIEGHKVTVTNAFSVFGSNGWSDMKGLSDEFLEACRRYDMAGILDVGHKFVSATMMIIPSLLEIGKRYAKVVDLLKDNYEILSQSYDDLHHQNDILHDLRSRLGQEDVVVDNESDGDEGDVDDEQSNQPSKKRMGRPPMAKKLLTPDEYAERARQRQLMKKLKSGEVKDGQEQMA